MRTLSALLTVWALWELMLGVSIGTPCVLLQRATVFIYLFIFNEIITHNICKVYKDKLQNCSCNQFHYIGTYKQVGKNKSDVRLTVHRNSVWIRKTNWMSLFVFFISLLIVAQHVSGNRVPIIRS